MWVQASNASTSEAVRRPIKRISALRIVARDARVNTAPDITETQSSHIINGLSYDCDSPFAY